MKKALMNASVASMIYKFNMDNINLLEELGYQVDVACNFGKENPISEDEINKFRSILSHKNINVYETSCPRNIFSIRKMFNSYQQLKKIANAQEYDLVHTQSPIGGVVCRLAFRKARKKGTKIIYQAHGFHFYKGSPLLNWIIFYPIEKICSFFTDILITINQEDYELAKNKFHAKQIEYVPGVGLDLDRIKWLTIEDDYRLKLGIPENATWLLSVGELNKNKNHETVIKAIEKISDVYYTIVGQGELERNLSNLIGETQQNNKIKLLGFSSEVLTLCQQADIFVFPSYREGLSVALMEAMASELPVACSKIRGNVDLIDESGGVLFNPSSVSECKDAILKLKISDRNELGKYNAEKIKRFSKSKVMERMKQIYSSINM